ncbi:hypothetical protein FKM82_023616 [Ascaphus truei]
MSTSTSSQPPTGQNPPRRSLPSAEGNPVQPKQALLKVLHTAGAKGDTFTLKQVMHYLGQYIMVKQLYDKQHQHIVNCGDDELGVLLGITSFSVKDPSPLYDMLKKNLHSVSCTDAAESPSRDQTQDTRGLERQKGPDEGTDVAESREGGDRDTGAAFSSRKHPAEDGDSPVSSKHPRLDLVFEEWDGAGLPWWFLGNLRPNYTPQSNGSTDIPSNQVGALTPPHSQAEPPIQRPRITLISGKTGAAKYFAFSMVRFKKPVNRLNCLQMDFFWGPVTLPCASQLI